jgi:hypothetical protein
MSTFCPRFVNGFVNHIFPTLRKTQKENLSLASYGMIKAQSGILSKIVRYSPSKVKHKHKLKRLWRFVNNYRVNPERLRNHWIAWCVSKFSSGKYVLIALDWTTLPGNIQCLMAAIPFKGRAIPLIWHICQHSDIKDSQNRKEERFVSRLVNLLPNNKRVILVSDRGFGRSSFIQFLLRKDILFVIRVKSKVWIRYGVKTKILLRKLYLKPEKKYWFKGIKFREDGVVTGVNMAAVVVKGSDDPWFLVTNLRKAETTISIYEKRFQIEEWFKDLKHELGISDLQTKNLKRVRRIILISAFSYAVLALAGKVAEKRKKVLEQVISGSIRESASIIWFAARIIEHNLLRAQFWKKVRMVGVAS